jgi:hypothetical protein
VEQCAYATPQIGDYYILVYGASAYVNVTLTVSWDGGSDVKIDTLQGQVLLDRTNASALGSPMTVTAYLEGDPEPLGSATTDVQGRFTINLNTQSLARINPEVPEGSDGPRGGILLVAENNGQIRTVISRSADEWGAIRMTPQTEAFASLLETTGNYSSDALMTFPGSDGWVSTDNELASLIEVLAEDVRRHFEGGSALPTRNTIFDLAVQHTDPQYLAQFTNGESEVPNYPVMAGGLITLSSAVQDVRVIDGTNVSALGEGLYRIGTGSESADTFIRLTIGESENVTYRLAPLSIRSKVETTLVNQQVTPQAGAQLGDASIGVKLHPFSLREETQITLTRVDTQGDTSLGRPILRMEPAGLQFDRPVEVTINYRDVGVEDPDAAEWLYGSESQGYQSAGVIAIDKSDSTVKLSLQHFSEILVKEVAANRTTIQYLDFGSNFILMIPARDYSLISATNHKSSLHDTVYKGKILTNRGITHSKVSARMGNSTHGGWCAQAVKNPLSSLIHGKYVKSTGFQALNNGYMNTIYNRLNKVLPDRTKDNRVLPSGVRESANDCQFGDYVFINNTATDGTNRVGHTVIFDRCDTDTEGHCILNADGSIAAFKAIESNGDNKRSLGFYAGNNLFYAIEINESENPRTFSFHAKPAAIWKDTANRQFICISPESELVSLSTPEQAASLLENYKTVLWEEKLDGMDRYNRSGSTDDKASEAPWLYYLTDGGASPDLFPVAPMNVDHGNTRDLRRDVRYARYAVYVSNFRYEDQPEDDVVYTLKGGDDIVLYRGIIGATTVSATIRGVNNSPLPNATPEKLRFDNKDMYRLRFVLTEATDSASARYASSFNMLRNDSYESAYIDASKSTKVLYSPVVIDDVYVSYTDKFNWECKSPSDENNCVRIGMNISNVSSMTLSSFEPYREPDLNALEGGQIYKSNHAVNGYFAAMGPGKEATTPNAEDEPNIAKWNFAHAGKHYIYVNLPLGYTSQADVRYDLKTSKKNGETYQPMTRRLKINSQIQYGGERGTETNWYQLTCEETCGTEGDANNPLVSNLFELTGYESLLLSNEAGSGKVYQVDAIQVVAEEERVRDGTVALSVSVKAEDPADTVSIQATLQRAIPETPRYASIMRFSENLTGAGATLPLSRLPYGDYRLQIDPAQTNSFNQNQIQRLDSMNAQRVQRTSASSADYLPETIYFSVNAENADSPTLPVVILRRSGQKALQIKVLDSVSGTILSGAQVDLRYGAGRDDETVAFSGETGANGVFDVGTVPYGTYTATVTRDGYAQTLSRIDVGQNTETQVTIIATQLVANGTARVVLSWGANPGDLDSHLTRYTSSVQDYHVDYTSRSGEDAALDVDVTSGYGPETITITPVSGDKLYRYVIHNYSRNGSISASGAVVSLTTGDAAREYYPPNEEGLYWHVFDIDNGRIVPCQQGCLSNSWSAFASITATSSMLPLSARSGFWLPSKLEDDLVNSVSGSDNSDLERKIVDSQLTSLKATEKSLYSINNSWAEHDGIFVTGDSFVAEDTNANRDLYYYDVTADRLTLLTRGLNSEASNAASHSPRFDVDGNRVLFLSHATNLVSGEQNAAQQLYQVDLDSGLIRRLSETVDGEPANGDISQLELAAEAGKVVFRSDASNLDSGPGLYLQDLETGLREVLVSSTGLPLTDSQAERPAIDASASLLAYDRPDRYGHSQIQTLELATRVQRQETPLNTATVSACCARISSDGRYLAWRETDTDGVVKLRLRDDATGKDALIDWPEMVAPDVATVRLEFRDGGRELWWIPLEQEADDVEALYKAPNPVFVAPASLH